MKLSIVQIVKTGRKEQVKTELGKPGRELLSLALQDKSEKIHKT